MKMAQSPKPNTYHISMVSTVSLIKPQVIEGDDDGTPDDIFISVAIGGECWQDKKLHMQIDTGATRNVMRIKHSKDYLVKM